MQHGVTLYIPDTDSDYETVLCFCGDIFRSNMAPTWGNAIEMMSTHLKEVNEPQSVLDDLQDQMPDRPITVGIFSKFLQQLKHGG